MDEKDTRELMVENRGKYKLCNKAQSRTMKRGTVSYVDERTLK